mmetsp:Transcript_125542/g.177266  ORF Transcript_125542/g.177266 Transcript_125542/m.177266 type:complete len:105 (+) Transcript_125542:58-372(+)|eukprot:symbB.v1.2.009172.t1/scaffold579.1/size184598/6
MAGLHLPRILPISLSSSTADADLVTQSCPVGGKLRSFKKESLQERRQSFRRSSEPLMLQKTEEEHCVMGPSSPFMDLMGLGVPDPDSRRHRHQLQLPALKESPR